MYYTVTATHYRITKIMPMLSSRRVSSMLGGVAIRKYVRALRR